ncbi:AIPR family protein [Lutimonas vermicola]|uniref:AIPR family protein n=1 Tax=Lutimonas vermicola TaxID=414288 RepID=A0ABU9KXE3_9FLAO
MRKSISKNVNFELEVFIKNLYHEVQSLVYSDEVGDSKENKFTEFVMETLADAGETEGIRLCPFIKENRFENIEYKINGYAIEEGYENIDIFISYFRDTNELYRLPKIEFERLIGQASKFVNAALKGHLEDLEPSSEAYGLAETLKKNRNDIIRVNIFVLSNGDIPHDPPQNHKFKNLEEILINFNIWDIERLHRLSESKGNREPIEIDFRETMGEVIPCLEMPSKNDLYECYLAIVPGTILSGLYRNYGTRLLESNVRAFLQATGKINRGIRDTIRFEPHLFLPYNNGLAATSLEVQTEIIDGKKVITSVKDFQIVNGGQTTASLFHTDKKYKEADLSKVFVQMKLTVIKDEIKKNETVPNISRFANSQNKVSELDLTSNNPFLQRLEDLSRTTYAIDSGDRNKQSIWFFERVKGQYREAENKEPTLGKKKAFKLKYPKNQMIIKSEIAKYSNLWDKMPYHVSKGSQKNYNIFMESIKKQFGKKQPGRVYWEDIVANAILFRTTDKLFGRKNQNPIGDTNIKSHTVSYSLAYFHDVTNNKINLEKIWKQQFIHEDLQRELKKLLKFVYEFFMSLDTALISEAAKKEDTWKQLRKLKQHPLDLDVVKKYLISDKDYKSRYDSDSDEVEEMEKYNNIERITSLGLKFWDGLRLYTSKVNCLTKPQINFAANISGKIKSQGALSDIEVKKGVKIIQVLQERNVSFEDVKKLSYETDIVLEDATKIINRLKDMDSESWKIVIAIGEKTQKLNYKEISTIKAIQTKLRKKETIDLNRLQIVDKALDKVKKFVKV